ncbi:MAG: hypothetical protein Q8K98_00420 [Bacteroidota bacterium]|nr:hypothetical protein [Bacteroidota bacterium]
MIRLTHIFLLFLWLSSALSQIDSEDTTDVEIEKLVEQTTDEEDSQLLDAFETEPKIIQKNIWSLPSVAVRSRIRQKLQTSHGYNEGKYLGSPVVSYQRIKLSQGKNISGGLLVEKDAGERKFNDYTNYFIRIQNLGFIKSVVIGDYVIEAGQGLVMWRGYDFTKGANIKAGSLRKGRDLMPHLSADEVGFLRGFATLLNWRRFTGLIFYSNKNLSASVDSLGNVTSFYSGYYRTNSEIAKRENLNEKVFGARTTYELYKEFKFGLTWAVSSYSKQIKAAGNNFFSNYGFDYTLKMNRINLYGEVAANSKMELSGVSVLSISPNAFVDVVALYRNYSPNYFNRFANPFGESFGGSNEEGFFIGLELKLFRGIKLIGYSDKFVFPKSKELNFSKRGNEYFSQFEYKINKNLFVTLRYKNKSSDDFQKNLDEMNREIRIIDQTVRSNYRINVDYDLSKFVRLRWRFEYRTVNSNLTKATEIGRMLLQDLSIRSKKRWTLNFRISYFKSDSYYSGISQYENDLRGVLSIPLLYGQGIKWYVLLKYQIINSLDFSLKYSYLIREDVRKIGSGWDELPANVDNRIGLQLDVRL